MKNFKFLSYLLIAASSLVFMQCTSDYTAIPGEDGVDGVDGIDGIDGADGVGVQECIDCHSAADRAPIHEAYALSGHANGTNWVRGTSGSCARCHNNEGYIDYLSGLFVDANGEQSADPDGYAVSNAITCTGCHSREDGHRSFDFENDGNDFALRNIDPIQLFIDPAVQLDMANSVDPLGRSNTCINCHQPRNSYPIPAGTGDYTITSQRFGPHYGAQSTLLEGIMGANIAGTTGYPGRGTAAHKTGASCTTCHMGPTTDGTDGTHTWEPTPNACITCHTNGAPTEVAGFEADFTTLKNLLLAKNYISEAGDVLGANGSNASSTNPLVVPVKEAQAIWNYRTFKQSHDNGVHNPNYAKALLKNSIEAMQN